MTLLQDIADQIKVKYPSVDIQSHPLDWQHQIIVTFSASMQFAISAKNEEWPVQVLRIPPPPGVNGRPCSNITEIMNAMDSV